MKVALQACPEHNALELTLLDSADAITEVALTGRLDAAGADVIGVRLSAAVAAAGRDALLNLSGVSFIASMGMRLLVGTARALHQKDRRLVAYGAPELVQQALLDAALDQIVPCVGSRDEALARLAG